MSVGKNADPQSLEERWNSVTHALGAVLSVAATGVLVTRAALSGGAGLIVGVAAFGASLILLYTASALYHAASPGPLRRRLRALDHAAIYLLIAGSYSPFVLGPLRGPWGWSLFGVVWGLAVLGVVFKVGWTGRLHRLSMATYIAMGWLALVAVVPMVVELRTSTLVWLVAGGLAYTVGTLFFRMERVAFAHTGWHLCVLGGSACHVVAVATLL